MMFLLICTPGALSQGALPPPVPPCTIGLLEGDTDGPLIVGMVALLSADALGLITALTGGAVMMLAFGRHSYSKGTITLLAVALFSKEIKATLSRWRRCRNIEVPSKHLEAMLLQGPAVSDGL
jgi:hypothetical protein